MTSEPPPKVLHIITGLNDGGAEAVLYRLVTRDRDHTHAVISLSGAGKYRPLLQEAGVAVDTLDLSPSRPSPAKLARLVQLVKHHDPDIVQTWMYHGDLLGGVAARLAGKRRIVWGLHNTTLDRHGTKWTTRQILRLNASLSRHIPARIASCSEKGVRVHADAGYAADKLVVVHNGYDIDAFCPDPEARSRIRSAFGIAEDEILLGCVARFDRQKDHANLLAAFRRVLKSTPSARLLLVGTGMTPDNAALAELVTENNVGDRTVLCGQRPDIPAIMNGIDIHVLASAFGEAFPNVVCEAMSCGTICVATDVGDTGVIVGDAGHICPPSDPGLLAAAISAAIRDLKKDGIAKDSRNRIERLFSIDRMVRTYAAIWAETA